MTFLVVLILSVARVLVLIVVVDAILSFFVSPYHPLREALGRIIQPLLQPIRRYVPPVGMFDFSPLVLILLIELVSSLLINLLQSLS